MAPLRSLGNALSSFNDFYARTGKDAVSAASPGNNTFSVSGGNATSTGGGYKYFYFTSPGNLAVQHASGGADAEKLISRRRFLINTVPECDLVCIACWPCAQM